jgi:uncharacterized protein (DUF427 family)
VEVRAHGTTIAASRGALLVSETGLPNRYYLPRADVLATLHGPTGRTSVCPYKGVASYFDVELDDGTRLEDAAWTYEAPLADAARVAGLVAFGGEGIEVEVGDRP